MPATEPSRAFSPRDLTSIRRAADLAVSPCDRWLVVLVQELSADGKRYDSNLLRFDLQDADLAPVALTADSRKKGCPRFHADGALGYLAQPDAQRLRGVDDDKGSPEEGEKAPMQVHRMPIGGGAAEVLTDLPDGVAAFQWSKDGSRLVMLASIDPEATDLDDNRARAVARKERKASGRLFSDFPLRYWDHFLGPLHPHLIVAAADGTEPRDLTPGLRVELEEASWDVSPDGRCACVQVSEVDEELRFGSHLCLVDLESGERRALTSGDVEYDNPCFSPDGRRLVGTAHQKARGVTGKTDLFMIEISSGDGSVLTTDLDRWPAPHAWLDDSRVLFTADEGGCHTLYTIDVDTRATAAITEAGKVSGVRVPSGSDDTVLFLQQNIHAPNDVHRVRAGGQPERLTHLNGDLLGVRNLVKGTSVTIEGHEGRPVQLWEVLPPDFDETRQYPLVLWIHGGPLGAYTDEFHFRWNPQLYAARGYVVIMVNPAGSTGFGQQFIEDNNGNWGGHCYEDLMRAVDAYVDKPWIDGSRLAAMGASFGGYMVNWIAGHTDRFRCLVSHAGLFNLPAFYGTTDVGPEWELEFGRTPYHEPELFERWSPHNHVGSFQTPTLVIHGELDYRVPLGEGLAMYEALQKQRVPSRFLYFPDENHWILKPANMELWSETCLEWLGEYLG